VAAIVGANAPGDLSDKSNLGGEGGKSAELAQESEGGKNATREEGGERIRKKAATPKTIWGPGGWEYL